MGDFQYGKPLGSLAQKLLSPSQSEVTYAPVPGGVMAVAPSLFASRTAEQVERMIPAKDAVVVVAFRARLARIDWETAQEVLDQAESAIEVAHGKRDKAEASGKSFEVAARAVVVSQEHLRRALGVLDAQGERLQRAEGHLPEAEATSDWMDPPLDNRPG